MKKRISFILVIALLFSMNVSAVSASGYNVGVIQVCCGTKHTGIIKRDGSLWMTGLNDEGQLGDGTNIDQDIPIRVMGNVLQVSCGGYHTAILKKDGSLWMTGYNNDGQLGVRTNGSVSTPVKIMDGVAQISCGQYFTGILKNDGSLWMTGDNTYGQLGDGTTISKSVPVRIMDGVTQISCGFDYTGIIREDGSLWMVGNNTYGQLGDGTTETKRTPKKILDGVSRISCGFSHTGIIKKDSSLWMTGNNNHGSLGDGTKIDKTSPIKVMDNIARVSCGWSHTGILKNDGSLWMVGRNEDGELGDGTSKDKSSPVHLMDSVAQISCGNDYTGMVKKDGSFWVTGYNRYGQLGNGTNEKKYLPEQIVEADSEAAPDPINDDNNNNQNNTNKQPDRKKNNGDGVATFRALTINGIAGNMGQGCDESVALINNRLWNNKNPKFKISKKNVHTFSYNNNNTPVNKSKIDEWISYSFKGTDHDDVSLFYYCGHSTWDGNSATDYGITLGETYYPWRSLAMCLTEKVNGKIIVIIDACFAGNFINNGVAFLNENNRNRFSIIAACSDNEESINKSIIPFVLNYSAFTYYIGKGLGFFDNICCADSNMDGNVSMSELSNYTNSKLYKETKNKKHKMHVRIYSNNPKMNLFAYNLPIYKKIKISSLKSAKKSVNIKWKKVKGIDKYQIRYSLNKSFKRSVKYNRVTYRKKGAKVKRLKLRKKYYFQIRAYRTVDGKTYNGKWSSTKAIKIKK